MIALTRYCGFFAAAPPPLGLARPLHQMLALLHLVVQPDRHAFPLACISQKRVRVNRCVCTRVSPLYRKYVCRGACKGLVGLQEGKGAGTACILSSTALSYPAADLLRHYSCLDLCFSVNALSSLPSRHLKHAVACHPLADAVPSQHGLSDQMEVAAKEWFSVEPQDKVNYDVNIMTAQGPLGMFAGSPGAFQSLSCSNKLDLCSAQL